MKFDSEKIGYKKLSARELLSKNIPHFLQFMAKNDVKFLNQSKRIFFR